MTNKEYIFYFLFFVIFIFSTLSGIMVLRSNGFRNPTNNKYVEGTMATIVGIILVLFGLIGFVIFFSGIEIFLDLT